MTTLVASPVAAPAGTPFDTALECMRDADVRFALLRDDPQALAAGRDLDILVDPADRKLLFAALERAGFVLKVDRRAYGKWVFLRWNGARFVLIDVHAKFVQNGIEYMSARLALQRLDRTQAVAQLGAEDRFLHVILHNLLGKPALQAKHVPLLRKLHAQGLDRSRIDEQARRYGLQDIAARVLDDFERCVTDVAAWNALRTMARRILMRRPASWSGRARYRWGDRWRWRITRRPVVLALLGPDGSGKTTFADALQRALHDTPLRSGRVYMGCWGHDLLPMRQLRRLIPPQVSYTRAFWARCGLPLALTAEERQVLRQGWVPHAAAAARTAIKGATFHVALGVELAWRFVHGIRRSRRAIVISDRWVHDLEFRQGKVPFVRGQRARRLLFRMFPRPDGILYLETPYDLVEQRKPQLDRSQFETMDAAFRRVLRPEAPLYLTSDAPPDVLVRRFLTQHWETLLARCNRRA
jgi:thymidylate kinase